MATEVYRTQVALLLNVLPEVAKEEIFALHGGTAINLFVRNMPRLSVDIDLTYLLIKDRKDSLQNISDGLSRISESILTVLPKAKISLIEETSKLLIAHQGAQIKLEVNQTNRGALYGPQILPLCEKAQEEFEAFCEVPVIGIGQLYGGKICAALDRQHPRDLFDVKYFLENTEFTYEHREGLLLAILSSNRPLEELLYPNYLDQRATLVNQFEGMTNESFDYNDFEKSREKLIETIHGSLTDDDKAFLISIQNLQPDWSIYDFERFPSVQWKLQNLERLKETNADKYKGQLDGLIEKLTS
uniref:Nucleotidyl transferase AbiEii/AbiGii toxin family protein n=1 Tax=Roseihalotalea indica TaxID=2867963 RepID=A0AA49GJL9_9BACT|nr:nucleotidyl transferase AbiEii/AbiGii toxin family protein [Tunicatimonas sp. TK19036]